MADPQPTPSQRFDAALEAMCEVSCLAYRHIRIDRCPGCDECYRIVDEYNAAWATYHTASRELLPA